MKVKKIVLDTVSSEQVVVRPQLFDDFIGQEAIKKILKTGLQSAQQRSHHLGHLLFSGPSGFGKTTMAQIVSQSLGVQIKIITGYALTKPSELISVLHTLQAGDVLFIDEIHRIKPNIEEVLYIAMEDFALDMVMPEGGSVRIPLKPFTLIGATTRLENLSSPFKNRFVYKFHFMDYTDAEKELILRRYLDLYAIQYTPQILTLLSQKIESVPREIHNFAIKLRDFLIAHYHDDTLVLHVSMLPGFFEWVALDDGGLTPLHQKYLHVLREYDVPVGVKTLAMKLGINEKSVEDDLEPLLLKLGKINKTSRGRVLM